MRLKAATVVLLSLLLWGITAAQTEKPIILISEIAYDTLQNDEFNEWVELLVVSDTPIKAEQIKVGDEETIGGGEGMMRFPKDTVLRPGEVIVIAQSAEEFKAEIGIYPHFEFKDSTASVPNMRPVSLLAGGDVFFANGGDEVIVLSERNQPLDQINYGDSTTYFAPAIQPVAAGYSLERVPPNCDTNTAGDFRPQRNPTPFLVPEFGDCPDIVAEAVLPSETSEADEQDGIKIGTIQGRGETAEQINQTVEFSGVVTAVTADKNASGITFYTVFVQDNGDFNDLTSDAIPVFAGRTRPNVRPGDRVTVSGQVTEFFGLTEIDDDDLSIRKSGDVVELPRPVELGTNNLPNETLEGMLVTLPEAIAAGPTFETDAGCGFSVIPAGSADLPIIRHTAQDDASLIIPILPNDDRDCDELPVVKRGDLISGLSGPLTWNFDQWKIIQDPTQTILIKPGEPLPLPEPIVLQDGQISVATLNVENLFDSVDDTGDDAEPKLSAEEIDVRIQKFDRLISHWLGCPTILAIQEVEKEHLLETLSEALATSCRFEYGEAHLESYDGRGIDNALLFDTRSVSVNQLQLRQTCTRLETGINANGFDCPRNEDPLFSRPPLEAHLTVKGQPLIVYVNHFKSKRGGERETAPRREAQAAFQADLAAEQLNSSNTPVIVLGDFNDFADSPTQQILEMDGRLENVLRRLPAENQYTFNFGGASQLIDGLFVSQNLSEFVTSVAIQHLNADYPDAFQLDLSAGYLDFKSTDHDPAIVVLTWERSGEQAAVVQNESKENVLQQSDNNNVSLIDRVLNSAARYILIPLAILMLGSIGMVLYSRSRR